MLNTYLVIQTLGFATGTVLFVLLIGLSWKAKRLGVGSWLGLWWAGLGLLWNAGSLAHHIVWLIGFGRVSLAYRLTETIAYSATGMLPTALLLLILQAAPQTHAWQVRAHRWARVISYFNATGLTLAFFVATLVPNFPIRFYQVARLSAYNLMLHAAAGLILYRSLGRSTRTSRTYSRRMVLLVASLALLMVITLHFEGPAWVIVLIIIAQQSSIPMAVVSLVFLARFRFADVFVKRSLIVLTAVFVALIYTGFIVEPLARFIRAHTRYTEASAIIATTTLWCALLLAFPRLERVVSRSTDRWLFRRPDYRRLAQAFAWESESVVDESALFALSEQRIQEALGVVAARMIPRAALQVFGLAADDLTPSAVIPLRPDHPARRALGDMEVEALLPIQVNGTISYFMAIAPGELGRKLLSDEMAFLLTLGERIGRKIEALQFAHERQERQLHEARLQQLLTQAELKALQAQINPHFLFNTLNTILNLIGSEPEKAEAMTERLADVFRYVLAGTDRPLIPVSEEVEFLRAYLGIEQERFGDRLQVRITVDPAVAGQPIPPLILQPLVENAVKHGLARKPEGGTIQICAIDERDAMHLVVRDDGVGSPAIQNTLARSPSTGSGVARGPLSPGGVGLRNVSERLHTLYGDRARMTLRSELRSGTCVDILIPKDEA